MNQGTAKDFAVIIIVMAFLVGFSMQDPEKKEKLKETSAKVVAKMEGKDTLVAVASLIETAKAEIQQFQQQIGTLQSEISVRVGRIQGWQIIAKDSVWVEKEIFKK